MHTSTAFLIAGTHSGCGKTTVTMAVLAALAARGLPVQPFKCGPDFIDPSLHQLVTGRVSRNLDLRMCGQDFVRQCFARHAGSCAVVEGVMGLFDGGDASAAALARCLDIPVLLVVDVRAMAESVAALVRGFASLDPRLRLAGVVCNRVATPGHANMLREAMAVHCPQPLLCFLPREEEIAIPSRHLGLLMGEEAPLSPAAIGQLARLAEEHLQIDQLLALAGRPDSRPLPPLAATPLAAPVPVAVARDAAFCFYYQDNLDLLRQAGAELLFFSPLHDAQLPAGAGGLYLGGGYPELHAEQLSKNESLRADIHRFAAAGRPVYGECGGLMYLSQSIADPDGHIFPMVGLIPAAARMQKQLRSLGYRRIRTTGASFFGPTGTVLHGHEFHFSHLTEGAAPLDTCYELEDGRREGYVSGSCLASYVHLHWGATPEAAAHFVAACRR